MRQVTSAALLAAFLAGSAYADNFTQKNVDKAQEIIRAAFEAHGGERLSELQTLTVEFEAVNYAVDQSRGTEPPWDQSPSDGFNAIDLGQSIFVNETSFSGGGFEGRTGTIVNGDESYQLDLRAGTVAKVAEPDFASASGPFVRVTPALLVRTLTERAANAYYLGETTVDDVEYDVVGFSMTVGPAISLYFDKDRHLLRWSERIFSGAGLVQYEFTDYEEVEGVPYNRTFRLFLNGDTNVERSIVSVQVDQPLDRLLTFDASLKEVPQVAPDPLTRQEIGDGVWLIGGSGTYAMFVDMGDYIFAAGGIAGIPERIASLREVVGDKPVRYGMLTHHHFDHVMGVPAYEAEGATVIASAAHEKIARRAADDGDALKIEVVTDRMALESDRRRIEIIDIGPTAHTEHLLVAYLPEESILFEADHFALPQSGPIPPAVTSTRTFAEALTRHGLWVEKILSAHSPRPGTMDDLRTALEAEVFQASSQ